VKHVALRRAGARSPSAAGLYRITNSVGANSQIFGGPPDRLSRARFTNGQVESGFAQPLPRGRAERVLISSFDSSNRSNTKKFFFRGR